MEMPLAKVMKRSQSFAKPFCVSSGKAFASPTSDPRDTLDLTAEDKPRAPKRRSPWASTRSPSSRTASMHRTAGRSC